MPQLRFELSTSRLPYRCVDHYTTKYSYFHIHPDCFILLYPNATLKMIKNSINAKIELLFKYCNITMGAGL